MAYTVTRTPEGERGIWGRLVDSLRSFWIGEIPSRDPALAQYFGGRSAASGMAVSEYTALNYSAVWAAVQSIAGSIASLPLFHYRRIAGDGKERYTTSRVYRLIHDDFNPEQTAVLARETMQAHVLTWGNAYAEIERNQNGEPLALWPLAPDLVRPERTPAGALVYRVRQSTGVDVLLPAEDMLHIRGLGDGLLGYSVVRKARESIALGLATEQFGALFFGNGGWPGLIAQHPGKLSPDAHKRLKDSLTEAVQGTKAHSLIVTEEGIKIEKVSIPPDDAQFLGTRIFQLSEIARWFNMPLHKLRELSHATFSNVEELNIDWVVDTLRPWLVKWEAELNRKLIRPLERQQQFTEHLVDGLLRGKHEVRYAAYAVGIQWGFLSPNDVRRFENMNPLGPEGDLYLVPLNMQPATMAAANATPDAAPPPPEPEPAGRDVSPNGTGRRAQLIAAHRGIVVDVVGRMIRKEAQAARRAVKGGPTGLSAWITAFYAEHERTLAEALIPAMRAHLAQTGSDEDPRTAAAAIAGASRAHSEWQLAQLLGRFGVSAGRLPLAPWMELVEHEVSRWERERPGQIADQIMTEDLAHALA